MKYLFCVLFILETLPGILSSQEKTATWVIVKNTGDNIIQADFSTVKVKEKSDIYVWGLQSVRQPLKIEGIREDIYKIKTYYLINPELNKYSILKVIYYGSSNRVIREFNYADELKKQGARYNYPILPGSEAEAIYKGTVKYLKESIIEKN
ncbi:MAG: hypothetical protein HF314_00165 [Ignavibacteria bacterium]|jgi:hypothetical protein|nr:hypothetical protein [Ignavibacteria bacterium]MCU7501464.1 hypothetical protein [Ignavibacteria bacterium]MCU7516020.1 hypothetical protein [Ignavibacteria bacterium]